MSFFVGSGRELPFSDGSFHAVVFHTVLSHVIDPGAALAEALRVTADGGRLAVFDGDYATTTVAVGDDDPLQACVDAAIDALVNDRYLVRRLRPLAAAAGWREESFRSHGYVEAAAPGYMLTLVDRGADALVAARRLGEPAAEALKAEARRRVTAGEFFAHIAYASLIARRRQLGGRRLVELVAQVADLVAQLRRVLEPQLLGGREHLLLELDDRRLDLVRLHVDALLAPAAA